MYVYICICIPVSTHTHTSKASIQVASTLKSVAHVTEQHGMVLCSEQQKEQTNRHVCTYIYIYVREACMYIYIYVQNI